MGFLKTSQSLGEACPSSSFGGKIFKEGVCLSYPEPLPSVYSVSGDNIIRTFYNETDINCEGNPVDTVTVIGGDCYSSCFLGSRALFKLSVVATPDVPTNTVMEAVYTGEYIYIPQATLSGDFSCNSTTIVLSIFENDDCGGKLVDTVTAISGGCYSVCNQGTGITFQLSVATPAIPTTNIFIEAVYTGECNGNYKNSFVSVYYKSLNTCNDNIVAQQGTVSFEISCNSTSSAVTIFGNDDCGGSPVYSLNEPIVNQCGDKYNFIEVCYN
ncbi:hypothetical protein ACTFIY_004466 [Dictyostelium cf. discoideum]